MEMADFAHLQRVQFNLSGSEKKKSKDSAVKQRASLFESTHGKKSHKYRTLSGRDGAVPPEIARQMREEMQDGNSPDKMPSPSKLKKKRGSVVDVVNSFNDNSRCPVCGKPVYEGPELSLVEGKRYHNWCFKCESCKTKLSNCTGNYRIENGRNFCYICYDKLFNPQKQNYPMANESLLKAGGESMMEWENVPAPSLMAGWQDSNKRTSPMKAPSRRTSQVSLSIVDKEETFGFPPADDNDIHESVTRMEEPFKDAGVKDGLEIWRIEGDAAVKKFNKPAIDVPADNVGMNAFSGNLYTGDVYIFLGSRTKPTGKRFGEIFYWIGEDASAEQEGVALQLIPDLKDAVGQLFGVVQHRRIMHKAEGSFYQKFIQVISQGSPKNFQLSYMPGGYTVAGKQWDMDTLISAARDFNERLIKIHIVENTIYVEEVSLDRGSLTSDAVFLLETFGKIYQLNGITCKPIERFEGKSKFQQLARMIERQNGAIRPSPLDFEIVMETRNHQSESELKIYDIIDGVGPEWKPLSKDEKTAATKAAHAPQRRASRYDGQKWTVQDTAGYGHSTSFFGGRDFHGPGRGKK